MRMRLLLSIRSQSRGFTLMELLVVVAILAIVAGLVTVAYDGLVGQAAKGASSNAISSLNNSIAVYQVTERHLPSNLDTLLTVTPNGVTWSAVVGDNVTQGYTAGGSLMGSINPLLRAKLLPAPRLLDTTEKNSLLAAGITTLRYMDIAGNANVANASLTIPCTGGGTATVGPIALVDVPSHLFDVPMDTLNGNRGRGFALDLNGTAMPEVAVLNPGPNRYDYVKLGVASPTAVLIVLGIGKNSSIVQAGSTAAGTATNARLSAAPFYGDVGKAEYPNYLAVIDISQTPAKFITVIDPTGGFLAENYAAGRGQ